MRGLKTDPLKGVKIGNIVYGTDGYIVISELWQLRRFRQGRRSHKNFTAAATISATSSKPCAAARSSDLTPTSWTATSPARCATSATSPIASATRSRSLQRLKRFGDDKEAAETFGRMEQHLTDNKVPLDETKYRIGRKLKFDPKTERFLGDKEADALLTRQYRKGFELPIAKA